MAGTLTPVTQTTSTIISDSPTHAAQAAASATAAAASAALTAADVVTTNADVVLTHADVVSTNADVVSTAASASAAATSATNAATSATAAAASAANLPNATTAGASKYIKSNATADGWVYSTTVPASEVANTPAGNIAATTVQDAIDELDTEKAAIAGAAFTGPISATAMDSTPIGGTTPAAGKFTDLSANAGYGSVAPIYGCRAWVNFDGRGTTGTNMTLRGSANIASVYKNGTGNYTITFTTAMPDANYNIITGGGRLSAGSSVYVFAPYGATTPSTTSFSFLVTDGTTTSDPDVCSISVFR